MTTEKSKTKHEKWVKILRKNRKLEEENEDLKDQLILANSKLHAVKNVVN
jgi:hypothetical protein